LVKVLGRWLSDAGGYVFATMGGGASKEQQAELYKKKEVAWIARAGEASSKLEALEECARQGRDFDCFYSFVLLIDNTNE
jgi:hypothetical protein